MTIKKLAGKLALLIGGSRCIGAVVAEHMGADRAEVTSLFVTNGRCNGVQQALRLWRPHRRNRISPNCDRPDSGRLVVHRHDSCTGERGDAH